MKQHGKINYVEFPSTDIAACKDFFSQVFGWAFQDYGPEYAAFSDQGMDGGFYASEHSARIQQGSALIVLYSDDLQQTLEQVEQAGGSIIKPIFDFPGGRRFHFLEPSGNEFAVWSDK